jgi:rubrerythrin
LGQVLEKFLNVISSGLDLPAGKIYVCSKCGFLAEEDEPAGCTACGTVKEELRNF